MGSVVEAYGVLHAAGEGTAEGRFSQSLWVGK